MSRKSRVWYWFHYNAKWALALLVAGVFSIWTRRGWGRIGKAFGLWFGLIRSGGKIVDPDTLAMRLNACKQCVLFYAPLGTCGSPLKRELRGFGCWCLMVEKAKYGESECYLDAEVEPGFRGGWIDTAAKSGKPAVNSPSSSN